MGSRLRVVVVGGGISGLAAAHFLRHGRGRPPAVTLVEGTARLGGKVWTEQVAGHAVDTGPDSLVLRGGPLRALVDELGLAGAVVEPGAAGAYIWSRGRLRPLPQGMQSGVPAKVLPLLRSRLLSPRGVARAGLDLVLPRRVMGEDPSVGELLRPRFGAQVFHRLIDPLLGGVHAGSADRLSARSVAPELFAVAGESRSLWWGMRRRPAPASPGPSLATLRGGLARLIEALAAGLDETDVRVGTAAVGLEVRGDGYRLYLGDGAVLEADAVVLAVPPFAAADLLAGLSPAAATALREVPYADVATVTLAYPRETVGRALDGTGFLVPPEEGMLLVGCSWLPAKWPHLVDESHVLLRAMVGRHGDDRFTDLDDSTLVSRVHDELAGIMDLREPPRFAHVQRWPRAMPQYIVGHQARLDRVDAALTSFPGVHVTGAGYRGLGMAGCVAQAQQTAQAVIAELASRGVQEHAA
ncbi:MAG: protoporphyrinogen oxidase [Lacisediminihabitans sp.]